MVKDSFYPLVSCQARIAPGTKTSGDMRHPQGMGMITQPPCVLPRRLQNIALPLLYGSVLRLTTRTCPILVRVVPQYPRYECLKIVLSGARMELAEQSQIILEEELEAGRVRRVEAERERDDLRNQLEALQDTRDAPESGVEESEAESRPQERS